MQVMTMPILCVALSSAPLAQPGSVKCLRNIIRMNKNIFLDQLHDLLQVHCLVSFRHSVMTLKISQQVLILNCMTHIKFVLLFMATVPAPGILHSAEVTPLLLKRIDHLIIFEKTQAVRPRCGFWGCYQSLAGEKAKSFV